MNKPLVAQETVLDAILEWSSDRPAWQRDALRRVVSKGRLADDDLRELVLLCKAGRGADVGELRSVPLQREHLPSSPDQSAVVTLNSVADVSGANSLAPGQTLAFESAGLTVIYGDNGAGKSGYARILKRACRARHAGKIEANVYDDHAPKVASASITYSVGGAVQPVLSWKDGPLPHALLSAVSVFDSECASIHLREKNEVAFRPFGLDVPDELANVCQVVKDRLSNEQKQLEAARSPIFAAPPWKGTTTIGKALAGLTADTDVKKVEAAATLSPENSARLERLKDDLAKNPAKAAAEQTLKADNVKRVIVALRAAEAASTDEALLAVRRAVLEARAKREAARLSSEKAFAGEAIAGVGSEVWRELWESARRYSTQVAYPGNPFPPTDDTTHCVLCLQPLGPGALARMSRFEQFVQQDTAVQAERAERVAASARLALSSVAMSTRDLKAALAEISIGEPDLSRAARRLLASARLRRYALLRSLDATADADLPGAVASPIDALTEREAALRKYSD